MKGIAFLERELLIFFEIYGQFYGQKLNSV